MSNILKYQNPSSPLLIQRVNKSNANFVKRLLDPNRKSIQNWVNPLSVSTHKLGWATENTKQGAFVYPEIQEINGELIDFTHPSHRRSEAINSAIERRDTVRMTPKQAKWFTENYKQYYPSFKKGGRIYIKKKNRGSFTRWCKGKVTAECIRRGKNSSNPAIRKKATFAQNARRWKHENGGVLKAQDGTGNNFWSQLWNVVKEGGMAARDAKLGAVGAQQVRNLYSEGKNQEAQDLAKQYAKANTTGIALAGGAASTGLLGDLMITGATTAADTFIDDNTKDFGKNLSINTAFDLAGHGAGKLLRNVNWNKVRNVIKSIPDNTKANIPISKSTKAAVEESKPRWPNTSQSKLTEWERLGIPKGDRNFDVQFAIARREGNSTRMQQLRDQHHFETFQKNKLVQNGRPVDWYHGQDVDFTEFDLNKTISPNFFFSKDKNYVARLMQEKGRKNPIIKKYYLYSEVPTSVVDSRGLNHATVQMEKHKSPDADSFVGADTGKDELGFTLEPTEIAIPYPRHIKSASPIVYDDNGHFIKLSKRDNIWNKDVRYYLGGKL